MSWTAPNLPVHKHLFFDRHGGVSTGKYDSLNFSLRSQDSRENINKNIAIAALHFNQSSEQMNILVQGTSNKAVYISQPTQWQTNADGAVTDKPNIILAIRTADCAPILLYDSKHQIIGAAHAGWRGALHGIIENTVSLMIEYGACPQDICAAIGPCLRKQSFICQQDMRQQFLACLPENNRFFIPCPAGFLFDAEEYCQNRLQSCGITNISISNINTYTDENYCSYRRNGHRNLIDVPYDYPTHLSTIML